MLLSFIFDEWSSYCQLCFSGNDEKIKNEKELKNWAKLLSTPVDQRGAGIRVSEFKPNDKLMGFILLAVL